MGSQVKSSCSISVVWMSESKWQQESFVELVQQYGDISVTSLRRTSALAYPTPVNIRDVLYGAWKRQMFEEQTVIAYSPVGIDHEAGIWKLFNNAYSKTSVPRAVKL